MRTLAAIIVAIAFNFTLFGISTGPAHAQIGEVTAAINAALRKAQKVVGSPRRKRSKSRTHKSLLDQAELEAQGPAPRPARNPQRVSKPQSVSKKASIAKRSPIKKKSAAASKKVVASAVQPTPPPPDVWTRAEIASAMKACRATLRGVGAKVVPAAPVKKGPCGDAAPVKLIKLSGKRPVTFSPAPLVNCKMVRALDTWLRRGLQPLARKHLGAPIVKISVMSSYSCRNAYGRKGGRLSEHGKANALDIGGFITADGVRTDLLAHWGPTERDIVAAARKAEQKRTAEKLKRGKTPPSAAPTTVMAIPRTRVPTVVAQPLTKPRRARFLGVSPSTQPEGDDGIDTFPKWYKNPSDPNRHATPPPGGSAQQGPEPSDTTIAAPPIPERRPSLRQRTQWAKARAARRTARQVKDNRKEYRDQLNSFLTYRSDLGGPKPKGHSSDQNQTKKPRVNRAAFLRGAHRTACRIFGTVLGPEANNAHRNHFHVDLAPRKRNNYCR